VAVEEVKEHHLTLVLTADPVVVVEVLLTLLNLEDQEHQVKEILEDQV
tara:strand:- start:454 stop:597 length:144 start_codon:yes stop_codon:yes gene_type:complete